MIRNRALTALVLVASLGSPVWAGSSPVEEIFNNVGATSQSCPKDVAQFGDTGQIVCGSPVPEFKAFRKSLERFVAPGKLTDEQHFFLGPWRREAPYRSRALFVRDNLFTVLYDADRAQLILVTRTSCLEDTAAARRLVTQDSQGEKLHPTARLHPEYPEAARIHPTDGVAVVDAIIDADGTIADACIIDAYPEGYGFEEAALRAVRRWRYDAAKANRGTVNRATRVGVEWTLHP